MSFNAFLVTKVRFLCFLLWHCLKLAVGSRTFAAEFKKNQRIMERENTFLAICCITVIFGMIGYAVVKLAVIF